MGDLFFMQLSTSLSLLGLLDRRPARPVATSGVICLVYLYAASNITAFLTRLLIVQRDDY